MVDETAAEFVTGALRHLVRGVQDRKSAFHVIGLATVGADGAPRVRSVVLRGLAPETGTLLFHTDRRAAKVEELSAAPQAEVLAYDETARLQIRLAGRVAMQMAPPAVWAGLQPMSRLAYLAGTAPGAPLSDAPALDEARGLENFVVGTLHIASADVLSLAAGGHRRAIAAMGPAGVGEARWVGP